MKEDARLLSDITEERPSSEDEDSYSHKGPSLKGTFSPKSPFLTPQMRKHGGRIGLAVLVLVQLILVLGLTAGAYHFGTQMAYRPLPEPKNLGSCGASPEEAHKKGCVFDFLLGAWIRPECMDHEMYDKYISEWKTLNMTIFSGPEETIEAGLQYAMEGNYEFIWGIGTFHYLHCSYVMEKNWKVLMHKLKAVPSNCVEDEHMWHCLDFNGKPSVEDLTDPNKRQIFQRAPIVDCLIYP